MSFPGSFPVSFLASFRFPIVDVDWRKVERNPCSLRNLRMLRSGSRRLYVGFRTPQLDSAAGLATIRR